jgi:hypothetical protein
MYDDFSYKGVLRTPNEKIYFQKPILNPKKKVNMHFLNLPTVKINVWSALAVVKTTMTSI